MNIILKYARFSALLTMGLLALVLNAGEPASPVDPAARLAEVRRLAGALNLQQGEVVLQDGMAKVKLPASFRYLNPTDTETVLHSIWGNPQGGKTLGMLVPADFEPLGESSWVVVMTYAADGHVKDDDAAKIDYTKMLADMKESMQETNK